MLRVTLRNLLARKVRLLMSAFAIVLGVAFVAGSLTFTDTMKKSFDDIVGGSVSDASVRFKGSESAGGPSAALDSRAIDASVVDKLETIDGASRVDPSVQGIGLFVVQKDGKLLGGQGAPTLSFNYNDAPAISGKPAVTISKGRPPVKTGEVALDAKAAKKAGYRLGDTVRMIAAGDEPRLSATLVGIAEFGGGGLAGATLVLFDTKTAQDIFLGGKDAYSSVALTAAPGVSQEQLADEAAALIPSDLEAVTGDEMAREVKGLINQVLDFLNIFLLVFASIALVVGTFLIINTFSILVAQRSRELALLRALGASRRQVTGAVLAEAFVVGLVGSTLGLLLGFALAAGLKVLFGAFGLDLSGTALVFSPRTAVAAYVVGMVVTLFAAYLPARRAAKIAPVAAMRDDIALPESSIRRRMVLGVLLAIGGAGMLTVGLATDIDRAALWVGLGVLAILLAVSAMSPVLGRPVLHALGFGYRSMFGAIGNLATQNALRNPRRTAATASALMIGLALVSTMAVLGASINKSIDAGVEKEFTSDFLVSNAIGAPFSTKIADQVRGLKTVGDVAEIQWAPFKVGNINVFGSATDTKAFNKIYDLDFVSGSASVGSGEVAFAKKKAQELGVRVGEEVTLSFPAGQQQARVSGIYAESNVVNAAIVSFSTLRDASIKRSDSSISVNAADRSDVALVGQQLKDLVADLPTVTVQNQEDFADAQRAQVNQLLYLIYALLGLAIVIAVLGIINTLALSVIERTREVGLLRAVGVSRRQLRRMVRLEAIAIAVLGAFLGVVMGVGFGVVLQRAVADQGITDLAIPWVQLIAFVALAAVVGVLAAVLPARRAAKLNLLAAITTE